MFIHNTLRRYTAALLNFFNDLEVQYKDSAGVIHSKNVPILFAVHEKVHVFNLHTDDNLTTGNVNVLPRGNLSLSTIQYESERNQNKNIKTNIRRDEFKQDYAFNGIAYTFNYELSILCRGMNEASMIMEQIASKFNMTVHLDIYDADGLDEPTRCQLNLLDIGMEYPDYDEYSTNVIRIDAGFALHGYFYQPIKSIERIKHLYMNLHTTPKEPDTVLGWDVVDSYPENVADVSHSNDIQLIDIVGNNVHKGLNTIEAIYESKNDVSLIFEWNILKGTATITGDKNKAYLDIQDSEVIVQCTLKDSFGNYKGIQKTFYIG